MGEVDMLAVFLGALAFFLFGWLWYGLIFSKIWQRETGLSEPEDRSRGPLIFSLAFLFELLIAVMLGHMFARLNPPPHVMMMMAFGFGATIMTPAIGIAYLFQGKSGTLFAIDAGHFIIGMLAMGAVFVAMA